ncbi:MAG: hypothetical protein AAF611_02720 [Bacteroidota bacterium]
MKTYFILCLLLLCVQIAVGQSQEEKEKEIAFLKFEMEQLKDSSEICFDKGIKLLKEGATPEKIKALIGPKLAKWEAEINQKLQDFKSMSEKLKLTEAEMDTIFKALKVIFKETREKYDYLEENGVKIN